MSKLDFFHHPSISITVIRRRACDELFDMLMLYGGWATRTIPLRWDCCFPSRSAYDSALYRLKKAGLLVQSHKRNSPPVLTLTQPHKSKVAALDPERYWKQKWNGRWYVLVYDIPEENRSLRDRLRQYLKRLRMGCLQQSTWVSPCDIRPDYHDLQLAIGVEGISFLFEARTVLGRKAEEIVRQAWDFQRINGEHRWYLDGCARALEKIRSTCLGRQRLETMAREETTAYLTAMDRDPLLPHALLPNNYRGREVHDLHTEFVAQVRNAVRRAE